jgi:hypothetical protein
MMLCAITASKKKSEEEMMKRLVSLSIFLTKVGAGKISIHSNTANAALLVYDT